MTDPIFDIFREEANEHLQQLENGLLDLEAQRDPDAVNSVIHSLFRHAHSMKGDGRALGLNAFQERAQVLEDLLDRMRSSPSEIDKAGIDAALAQVDLVRQSFEAWRKSFEAAPPSNPAAQAEPAADTGEAAVALTFPDEPAGPHESLGSAQAGISVRVPSERLDRMINLCGELRIQRSSAEVIARKLAEHRQELEHLVRHLNDKDRSILEASTDQVRRIEQQLRALQIDEDLLAESLETEIRQARMLPLGMLADSLRRPLRDLSNSLAKEIDLQVDVGNIWLDKAVMEALRAPLLHLLRNACDHGIESPQQRRALGKPPGGTIQLMADRQRRFVRIAIRDDGRGLDFPRIRERLTAQRILEPAESVALSEQALAAYLFHPGFTTSAVGNISGRGVGLDAVRDAVHRLRGEITIDSRTGQGTTFTLLVPTSISTIRVLSIWSGGNCYGVPSTQIRRTGRVRAQDLKRIEDTWTVTVEGQSVKWVALQDLLNHSAANRPVMKRWLNYLLIRLPQSQLAVAVDEFDDERETLLKPLEFPLDGTPGIAGGAIRPDGTVQLILDFTDPLIVDGRRGAGARTLHEESSRRILVVDDSPTTRAMLRALFTSAGYSVLTAADGLDALEVLRTEPVDLVVSDFEMPRLNGPDLTRQIKSRYRLPVVLVTGREQEEHRREGLDAGADAYVVKSTFQGGSLLDVVQQLV